jgi:hypothetical protein
MRGGRERMKKTSEKGGKKRRTQGKDKEKRTL